MTALGLATFEGDLESTLALGPRALAWSEHAGRPALLSAQLSCEALVLGALQRADTLATRSAARFGLPLARRATTGTEAELSGTVLYHALALPRVDALFPDASARTLLNRNVRALLRGYTKAGVPLRYFGTEVLALLGHPVALLGYDQSATGAVLIEALIGLESPCVVRPALKREPPAALLPLLGSSLTPAELLHRAVAGIVQTLGLEPTEIESELPSPRPPTALDVVGTPATVAVPLGVVEAVAMPSPRITGDLLIGTAGLSRFEAAAAESLSREGTSDAELGALLEGVPLDGARVSDVLAALGQARKG